MTAVVINLKCLSDPVKEICVAVVISFREIIKTNNKKRSKNMPSSKKTTKNNNFQLFFN